MLDVDDENQHPKINPEMRFTPRTSRADHRNFEVRFSLSSGSYTATGCYGWVHLYELLRRIWTNAAPKTASYYLTCFGRGD
jgi:hypothetical protein